MALLDDLRAVAAGVAPEAWTAFLGRLVRAAELLEANANPELLVDTLVLAWPRSGADGSAAGLQPRGDASMSTVAMNADPDRPKVTAPRRNGDRPRAGGGLSLVRADAARGLGLPGWVANEADGSVRCVAEGPRVALEALLRELSSGPLNAHVERVVPRWGPAGEISGLFEIRSRAHSGD